MKKYKLNGFDTGMLEHVIKYYKTIEGKKIPARFIAAIDDDKAYINAFNEKVKEKNKIAVANNEPLFADFDRQIGWDIFQLFEMKEVLDFTGY